MSLTDYWINQESLSGWPMIRLLMGMTLIFQIRPSVEYLLIRQIVAEKVPTK